MTLMAVRIQPMISSVSGSQDKVSHRPTSHAHHQQSKRAGRGQAASMRTRGNPSKCKAQLFGCQAGTQTKDTCQQVESEMHVTESL